MYIQYVLYIHHTHICINLESRVAASEILLWRKKEQTWDESLKQDWNAELAVKYWLRIWVEMNWGVYSGLHLEMVDHFIKCETDSQVTDKNSQSPYPLLLTNSQIENLCLWIQLTVGFQKNSFRWTWEKNSRHTTIPLSEYELYELRITL